MSHDSKGEARTLSALLQDSERLPRPEALRIARSILAELRKLHETGVIHCNLHPGCVLLQDCGLILYRLVTGRPVWERGGIRRAVGPGVKQAAS